MPIQWSTLSPREFENVCAALLEQHGFTNVSWHGASGGDRGRDLTAERVMTHLGSLTENTNWIVQCRRYISKPPTKSEIHDWLVSCKEHSPHYVLLIVSNTLSSDTKDWLAVAGREFRFKVLCWEQRDLERELTQKRQSLAPRFPDLYATARPALELYLVKSSTFVFRCNEVEEVQLRAFNCNTPEEAKVKIRSFVEALREHDAFVE